MDENAQGFADAWNISISPALLQPLVEPWSETVRQLRKLYHHFTSKLHEGKLSTKPLFAMEKQMF